MRIGIVCYPTFGGSGVVATELGMALAHKGHTVHFITYDRPVRLRDHRDKVFYHEVRVSDYPLFDYPPYELVLSSKIVDVAKYEGLDLLHVHYAIPHANAAWMAQQILASQGARLPFITTLHGTDITLVGKDPSFEPVITFSIERSNAVTAVSESLKRDTYAHFPVQREIEVIPNFVCTRDYPRADPELRRRYAAKGEHLLVHISNFRKVKRVGDVVEVFRRVREKLPSKLLLIGDGPERQRIETLCRAGELCGDIVFLGKMTEPEKILASCDLFVLTSESERFGLAALEAMACRVPVVTNDTGGTPEVVEHGKSGALSGLGDVDKMASNALEILSDAEILERYREGAFARARQFDVERILPRYEELYDRVLRSDQ
ncbi:MAG: N-acetyl-alpha-D-glucosaminyl L-malate synthase BshA [Flavobacteriales bacterium]|nr:N-acetyl-alpha-D-glucosaminyl L-malate synthase BshA [Flavobacteriales bacterium]